jgi:hypothetical protein
MAKTDRATREKKGQIKADIYALLILIAFIVVILLISGDL